MPMEMGSLTKSLTEVAFLKCCMFPIFGAFSKFSGRWGKLSHVSEQWANLILKKLKPLLLCFLHYSSIPQNEFSLKPHNLNCCGCLLATVCHDRMFVLSSTYVGSSYPTMGQVDQNATFYTFYTFTFTSTFYFLLTFYIF